MRSVYVYLFISCFDSALNCINSHYPLTSVKTVLTIYVKSSVICLLRRLLQTALAFDSRCNICICTSLFFLYETWWYFWAETCSSLETTCYDIISMVVFDGHPLIVSQHNGMSFVRVIVTKLYIIWAIENVLENSNGRAATVQEFSAGIAELFFFLRRAVQVLYIQKDPGFQRRLSWLGDILLRF